MDVIRHNNITPDSNVGFGSSLSKLDKGRVGSIGCEDLPTAMRAKSDEVNGWIVSLKDFVESRRPTTKFSGEHEFWLAESSAILQCTSKTAHSAVATPQCVRF